MKTINFSNGKTTTYDVSPNKIVTVFDQEAKQRINIRAQYLKIGESFYEGNKPAGYCAHNDYASDMERREYIENSMDFMNIN